MYKDIEDIIKVEHKVLRVLVTGAAGFIGSNILNYLSKNYPLMRLVALDTFGSNKFHLGSFKNIELRPNIEVLCMDLSKKENLKYLESNYKFDCIFHLGAISDTTCTDTELVMATNYTSFSSILELASTHRAKLIYASSAAVYGKTSSPNTVGKGEIPENIYGFSKLAMDNDLRRINANNVVGIRIFNAYGKGEYFKKSTASMILQLGMQAINKGEVRLFEDGSQSRDFVYIDDIVQGFLKAMSPNAQGIYNLATGVNASFNDVIDALKSHLGDFKVTYIPNPYPFFQSKTLADTACFIPDYKPLYDIKTGISAYISDIKACANLQKLGL
ncbi:NAD-dependent epimerase/dehydratase family protein [Helicobacter sp. 11S02629-2]|uniref:NAD-dependent epimerase/dehydratase family protein n=1 Tax=Helicobacter sp. 11S02629-2 TaxID=1476195 RepID=UPI000BA632A2|nr:NAD-dependent epimerase/dehydratase family protein [Helicobacter sp. 11S02629-2]PAF45420.1 hypothetical protein BKH40_02840 [Helicobacter sp. 11S02629-2]